MMKIHQLRRPFRPRLKEREHPFPPFSSLDLVFLSDLGDCFRKVKGYLKIQIPLLRT